MKYLLIILSFFSFSLYGQLAADVTSYWTFDESSGNALDQVGSVDGTVGANVTQGSSGKLETSYLFDGQNASNVSFSDDAALQIYDQDVTLSVWVYPTTSGASMGIFGGEDNALGLYLDETLHPVLTEVNTTDAPASDNAVTVNQWNHITVWFDNSETADNVIYGVNGVYDVASWSGTPNSGADMDLIGHRYLNIDKFIGRIDEPGIWKGTLLTESQRDSLYNSGAGFSYPFTETEQTYSPSQYRLFSGGVEYTPYYAGILYDPTYKYEGSPISTGDTIQYFLYEDFETWVDADVQSFEGLSAKWDVTMGTTEWYQQSIVNIPGSHGKVWKSEIMQNDWHSLVANVFIDTALQDLYVSYDMYLDPLFQVTAANKTTMGLSAGNYDGLSTSRADLDTITTGYYARSGWFQTVGTSSRIQPYTYLQNWPEGSSWEEAEWVSGVTWPDSVGSILRDPGVWHNYTLHLNTGDPGYANGYGEVYYDGTLVSRFTGMKMRGLQQGEDFGLIEQVFIYFFFGGPDTGPEAEQYKSLRNQYLYWDNICVYAYLPDADNYTTTWRAAGAEIPIVKPYGSYARTGLLADETFKSLPDTIYDVGAERGKYIWNPPDMHGSDVITKTVIKPSGTVSYTFLVEEFGFAGNTVAEDYYVNVYTGTGESKVYVTTYGRLDRGYTNPLGSYNHGTSSITFEIHTGYSGGDNRGVAISIW